VESFTIGKYKASFQHKYCRWQISSAKGNVGGKKTAELCAAEMQRLCEVDKEASGAPSEGSSALRKSSRSSTVANSALRSQVKPRIGAYRAGPGRSHTKPQIAPIDPIDDAISVAKSTMLLHQSHSKAQVVSALSQMVAVNTSLKRKVDRLEHQKDALSSLLMDQYDLKSELAQSEIKRRRIQLFHDLGRGYQTEITFKRHRAHALAVIKSLCREDVVMQRELAEALAAHYNDPAAIEVTIHLIFHSG